MRESTACPGCGLELPPNRWAVPPRSYASSECVELSGEVVGFESEHFELVRDYHQLFVDAYLAQHAPPVSTDQPISVPYSLVGLHLALDRDVAGRPCATSTSAWAGQRVSGNRGRTSIPRSPR